MILLFRPNIKAPDWGCMITEIMENQRHGKSPTRCGMHSAITLITFNSMDALRHIHTWICDQTDSRKCVLSSFIRLKEAKTLFYKISLQLIELNKLSVSHYIVWCCLYSLSHSVYQPFRHPVVKCGLEWSQQSFFLVSSSQTALRAFLCLCQRRRENIYPLDFWSQIKFQLFK